MLKIMRVGLLSIVGFLAYAQHELLAAGSACTALLQWGVYDKREVFNNKDEYRQFASWYCNESTTDDQRARTISASAGIPIGDIPVQFGASHKDATVRRTGGKVCDSENELSSITAKERVFISNVSSTLTRTFLDCIRSEQGLVGYTIPSVDASKFEIEYFFRSQGPPHITTVRNVVLDNAHCSPALKAGQQIDSAPQVLLCTRDDLYKISRLAINTTHGNITTRFEKQPVALPIVAESGLADRFVYKNIKHDCNEGIVTFEDRFYKRDFSPSFFYNCGYFDWTTDKQSIVQQAARSSGLLDGGNWALASTKGNCDNREFQLFNKSTRQIETVTVKDNCAKINFHGDPARPGGWLQQIVREIPKSN